MSLLDVAIRGARGVRVENLAAALAALVTGAAVFLMPTAILQEAVLASGMADTFAPLQPPLGWKARLGLSLLSAGSAFGMVLLLMRLVVRTPSQPVTRSVSEDEAGVPKLRRRDRHPDAPARPPLSVSRDLGVDVPGSAQPPEAASPVLRKKKQEAPERAPTIRREPQDPVRAAAPWLRKADEEEPAPLPRLSRVERAAGWEPEEPVEAEEPAEEEAVEQVAEAEPVVCEPEVLELPAPEPEPAAEAPAPDVPEATPWLEEPRPQPESPREESIHDLVARFERALERRAATPRRAEPPVAAAREEDDSDRLRLALESLKRFAPRQG
jgi:hypothetical protein